MQTRGLVAKLMAHDVGVRLTAQRQTTCFQQQPQQQQQQHWQRLLQAPHVAFWPNVCQTRLPTGPNIFDSGLWDLF
ncbi:hypothetical protein AWZ03_014255 [Drosophila navojoa]|uniref:Uncharacterized protein n=1 Tax=Drosophila navojoa TaxID=7232 RepID=A0A484ASH4_DRONA|nr:hypothetical protein AWZ03_014255 [Drosophila navojoa]